MKKSKIAEGSNKDLWTLEGEAGVLKDVYKNFIAFDFSDRISVFDWGDLDCGLLNRGKNLERFALAVAKHMKSRGIAQACDLELSEKAGCYVSRVVSHPKFDTKLGQNLDSKMEAQASGDWQFLPLEFIVRWGIPQGSSLLKRQPDQYSLWQRFEAPLFEYSTKLEAQDRMVDKAEAQSLLADSQISLDKIEEFLGKTTKAFESFFSDRGLELWDAKFELAVNTTTSDLMLVDAVTPDEIRVTMKGVRRVPLSKEMLRAWLRQTPWFDGVVSVKASAESNGESKDYKWQQDVALPVPQIGEWRREKISSLYEALAELAEEPTSKALWDWVKSDSPANVAVIGAGGREEATRWRLQKEGVNVSSAKTVDEVKALNPNSLDAVIVSMDGDLADGVTDELAKLGYWTFGPSQQASKLEWSKLFGREVAMSAGVPAPLYSKLLKDFDRETQAVPVLKLNGLAAGKGVYLYESWEDLEAKVKELEAAKEEFYFEERCEGFEASIFFECLRDSSGKASVKLLGSAQDFKRRFLGDEGPNTGGMGAWVPHPKLKAEDLAMFQTWALRTVAEMERRGDFYRGILYVGAMKDVRQGWKLIEFNARFGDPETQALLTQWPRDKKIIRSMLSLTSDFQDHYGLENLEAHSLCLSLVNPQYPERAEPIELEPWDFVENENTQVFRTNSKTGRMAYIVAQDQTRHEAGDHIFEVLITSPWREQLEWRTDILK